MLGAGSPPNPRGDAAVSEDGIVQGHAYSIMRVEETEDEDQSLKLRNPHGMSGVEWRGDWKDNGSDWTEGIIAALKKGQKGDAPFFARDGAFWMSVDDWAEEFQNLYVCRVFNKARWKQNPIPINGAWSVALGTS